MRTVAICMWLCILQRGPWMALYLDFVIMWYTLPVRCCLTIAARSWWFRRRRRPAEENGICRRGAWSPTKLLRCVGGTAVGIWFDRIWKELGMIDLNRFGRRIGSNQFSRANQIKFTSSSVCLAVTICKTPMNWIKSIWVFPEAPMSNQKSKTYGHGSPGPTGVKKLVLWAQLAALFI